MTFYQLYLDDQVDFPAFYLVVLLQVINQTFIYQVCDLLSTSSVEDLSKHRPFDVCVDKGTYDAISLRQAHVMDDRRTYSCSVKSLLKEGGMFIITSCNWTCEQLKHHFQNGILFFKLFYKLLKSFFSFLPPGKVFYFRNLFCFRV